MKAVPYKEFWINMILLAWASLAPVVTAWLVKYPKAVLPQFSFCLLGFGWAILLRLLQWGAQSPKIELPFLWKSAIRVEIPWLLGIILSLFVPYSALVIGLLTLISVPIKLFGSYQN